MSTRGLGRGNGRQRPQNANPNRSRGSIDHYQRGQFYHPPYHLKAGRGRGSGYRGGRFQFNQGVLGPAPSSVDYALQQPVCQVCNRQGHIALACPNRFNHAYQIDALPFTP